MFLEQTRPHSLTKFKVTCNKLCGVPLSLYVFVVFNQGCCVFIQYNLLKGCCEWILIKPWTQVIDYLLPGLTWHTRLRIGISHLSISGIVVHGRCYISHCFYFLLFFYFLIACWLIFVCCFCFHVFQTVVWGAKNPY